MQSSVIIDMLEWHLLFLYLGLQISGDVVLWESGVGFNFEYLLGVLEYNSWI